jgi:predicted dehydrogenase
LNQATSTPVGALGVVFLMDFCGTCRSCDLEEADALLEEADTRELFFAINFNHRYARPMRLASEAIRAGHLGEVVYARWRFGGEAGTSTHPHANLIETQCHGFDMPEYLCGPIQVEGPTVRR